MVIADVVILNESSNPRFAGDVQVYVTTDELCRHLESWAMNEPHLALRLDGTEVCLASRGAEVYVLEERPYPGGEQILKVWLRSIPERELRKLPRDVLNAIRNS